MCAGSMEKLHESSCAFPKQKPLYLSNKNAGWSSLVARQAHNLKAVGSNPTPATQTKSVAWTYILQNPEGRFYVGMTTDLDQRVRDHNDGISKWTKHRGPWDLVWSQECATIGEARKLENKIKHQGRGDGFFKLTGLGRFSGS